jgi:hypothetical protein
MKLQRVSVVGVVLVFLAVLLSACAFPADSPVYLSADVAVEWSLTPKAIRTHVATAIVGPTETPTPAVATSVATGEVRPTATPAPPTAEPATPTATPAACGPQYWDPRLDDLGITVECRTQARYWLKAVWLTKNGNWDDVPAWAKQWQQDTLGGDRHVFGRAQTKGGAWVSERFFMAWPYPNVAFSDDRRPEPDGWANLPMGGQNWNPANGQGPYTWFVDSGDKLNGLGMPYNWHWSFFALWEER